MLGHARWCPVCSVVLVAVRLRPPAPVESWRAEFSLSPCSAAIVSEWNGGTAGWRNRGSSRLHARSHEFSANMVPVLNNEHAHQHTVPVMHLRDDSTTAGNVYLFRMTHYSRSQ